MNKHYLRNLLITLLVIGLVAIGWHRHWTPSPSAGAKPTPPSIQPRSGSQDLATVNQPLATSENSVKRLVARHMEWRKITDSAESDKIEIELKSQITDADAAAIVRALPPELLQTPFGLMALGRWAGLNRTAAVKWLSSQKNPTAFQISTSLRGWVAQDTDGLHHYLDSLPEGDWKDKVLTQTARDALNKQLPTEAITLLRDLEPGDTQTGLAKTACILWAQNDPAAAVAWADQVDDPLLKRCLLGSAAVGSAFSDPQNAATWLLQSVSPGAELNEALTSVVQVWVEEASQPETAAAWVAQLPPGNQREAALKGLVSQWRQQNPQAFAEWMNSPQASAVRQEINDQIAHADSYLK